MSDILYPTIGIIGVLIILILFVRERSIAVKDNKVKSFINLLIGTGAFCLVDAFWGICDTQQFIINRSVFTVASFLFHSFSGFISFIWFRYTVAYVESEKDSNPIIRILYAVPFVSQTFLLVINFWTGNVFSIDANCHYHTGSARIYSFMLQFFYFVYGLSNAVISYFKEKEKYKKARYLTVIIFSIIPILMGMGQFLLPFMPVYSIGFILSCILIFTFNSTNDQEKTVVAVHEESNLRKISEYKNKLSEALANQNAIYFEILKNQINGIIAFDMDNNIIFINDSAAQMFGYDDANHFDGDVHTIIERSQSNQSEQIIKKVEEIKENCGKVTFEITTNSFQNKTLSLLMETSVNYLKNGKKIVISNYTDISSNKRLENELLYLSETDELTKISNRRSGERKTELLLLNGIDGMFCIFDVDKFKTINDSYGHAAGDKVLAAVAHSMTKSFRGRDVTMRLGGDEFSVYAVGIKTEEQGRICVERLFKEIDRIDLPELKGHKVSVSVGAVLCSQETNISYTDYYKFADSVMYISKKAAGNHLEFYTF